MKEFPKFDYNGISYDLCFYDDSVQLYAVENAFSGVMVSQLIPAANDYIAITGFSDFIEKRKSENDTQVYNLYRVGCLDIQKIRICDSEKDKIITSQDDLKKWLEDAKTFMMSWNQED